MNWLDLSGLFAAALLAATILPAQSEAVLVALLAEGDTAPWLLVTVASAGNVLGACLNYLLGRFARHWRDRRWFPVGPAALARAEGWYRHWGRWSLPFSWLPVIGDPLTVAAGALGEPFRVFLPLVALGKVARYVVLAGGTAAVTG